MRLKHFTQIAVVFVLVAFAAAAFAGKVITVNGTITDDYLLVDDNGKIYTVVESDKADELLDNVGSRVSVTGDVEEGDDGPLIDVQGFKVIPEQLHWFEDGLQAGFVVSARLQAFDVGNRNGAGLVALLQESSYPTARRTEASRGPTVIDLLSR